MTIHREARNKAIKRKYVELRSQKVKPSDAREQIAAEYFLSESTVKQILFDRKYFSGKYSDKV